MIKNFFSISILSCIFVINAFSAVPSNCPPTVSLRAKELPISQLEKDGVVFFQTASATPELYFTKIKQWNPIKVTGINPKNYKSFVPNGKWVLVAVKTTANDNIDTLKFVKSDGTTVVSSGITSYKGNMSVWYNSPRENHAQQKYEIVYCQQLATTEYKYFAQMFDFSGEKPAKVGDVREIAHLKIANKGGGFSIGGHHIFIDSDTYQDGAVLVTLTEGKIATESDIYPVWGGQNCGIGITHRGDVITNNVGGTGNPVAGIRCFPGHDGKHHGFHFRKTKDSNSPKVAVKSWYTDTAAGHIASNWAIRSLDTVATFDTLNYQGANIQFFPSPFTNDSRYVMVTGSGKLFIQKWQANEWYRISAPGKVVAVTADWPTAWLENTTYPYPELYPQNSSSINKGLPIQKNKLYFKSSFERVNLLGKSHKINSMRKAIGLQILSNETILINSHK